MKKFGLYGRAATALVAAVIIGAAPLATGGTAWAAADVSPPTLISGSVDKKTFNLANGSATFTVTIKTADPSGVETPVISASSTTTTQSAGFGQMTLVSGTSTNGTWQRTISIPATAAPGTWEVTLFPLSDNLGNSSNFTTIDLITLNAPTPPDVSPPTLISGSVDKKTFNLANGAATFTVTIKTADPSGVETPVISASSTTTTQSAGFGQMTLVSGTSTNGTWQRTISIPATAAPGTWEVTLFPLSDNLGNSSNFTTIDLITLTTKSTLVAGTPTVSGTAAVGLALTAKTGTWTPGTLFTYRWLADGVVLSGATSQTYTPTAGMVGKKLAVQVTGSRAGYDSASKTSGATSAVAKGTLASATPAITGTAKVGSPLTANAGKWTSGATLTYQWAADGASITGATKATFTPAAAQLGKRITVSVTGTLAGYSAKTVRSAATSGAIRGTLTASTPTISGTPKVGVTLTAKPGAWTPGTAYSYQWLANNKVIVGATKNTFKPTSAQRGLKVSVQVTGSLSGYSSVSKKSAQTAVVAK